MSPLRPGTLVLALCCLGVPAHAAIVIDGQLDADYGPATLVQTNQTNLVSGGLITGDNTLGDVSFANGSELDAAYALVYADTLHLFLTGNVALRLTMQQNDTRGHILDVFFDTAPGGQNLLNGLGTGNSMNGMIFDTGFAADYYFELSGSGDQFGTSWTAGRSVLTAGSGTFTSLGSTTAGSNGTLTGGTNPFGIKVTIDNRNTGGVGLGCAAASGAGVTTGIEWMIPLAAIGSPAACFRMTVIVRDGTSTMSPVSNNVLAPVPVGTCALGAAQNVDFTRIQGDQTFEVCPSLIGVPAPGAGALALSFVGANPTRGGRLSFRYALPREGGARLELVDVAGRAVRRRALAGTTGVVDLSDGVRLSPGIYWARLTQAGTSAVRAICVTN